MGYRCLGACIMPGLSSFAAVPVLLRSSMIHVPSSWRCPWQYYYVTTNRSTVPDNIEEEGINITVIRDIEIPLPFLSNQNSLSHTNLI
jgi:hypothetical protein